MIGERVGSYRIVASLGAGGMGTVWLAEHTLLGRRVAIKFLHASVSQSASLVERFFAEARAATRIADPGIVVIYDFGWHSDNSAYIVMEHLDGESLAARLRAGRFSVATAVRVVQQAAMAMAVAHAGGIIHRDLKPDNIFLIPDAAVPGGERVKILDFGIAKLIGDDHGNPTRTRTGLIMGTPMYMSPEQCRGAGDVDHRTDIYALGCVMFHLMCGRPPFFAPTPGDMIAAQLREMPQPPSTLVPEIPLAIDTIVMRCLAKAAGDRYATMTELVRDLRMAIGSLTAVPTIAPLRAKSRSDSELPDYSRGPQLSTLGTCAAESLARPPPLRSRRRIGLAVGAALLTAVAITILVARSRPASSPGERPAITTTAPGDGTSISPDAETASDAPALTDAATPIDAKRIDARPRPVRPYDPFEERL